MPNIHQTVIIACTAGKIYDALTSKEGLSAWWTPYIELNTEEQSVRFTFGEGYYKEMKIVEQVRGEKLRWMCITGAEEWIDTTIIFELKSGSRATLLDSHPELKDQLQQQNTEEITMLAFQHTGWKHYTPMFSECSYTWGRFLRSLKLYCETGKGNPWPCQHKV